MKTIKQQLEEIKPQLVSLLQMLTNDVTSSDRASDDPSDNTPAMQLTIGFTPDERERCYTCWGIGRFPDNQLCTACNATGRRVKPASWNYQTGDNSFTGGAYGHPHWALAIVFQNMTDVQIEEAVEDILNQLGDFVAESE